MEFSPTITVEIYTVSHFVKHKSRLSDVQIPTLNTSHESSDFPVDFDNFMSESFYVYPKPISRQIQSIFYGTNSKIFSHFSNPFH